MREFWKSFEVEQNDFKLMKEEALAERAALSVLKSGEIKGTNAEKVLTQNEFAASSSLLKQLKTKND